MLKVYKASICTKFYMKNIILYVSKKSFLIGNSYLLEVKMQ